MPPGLRATKDGSAQAIERSGWREALVRLAECLPPPAGLRGAALSWRRLAQSLESREILQALFLRRRGDQRLHRASECRVIAVAALVGETCAPTDRRTAEEWRGVQESPSHASGLRQSARGWMSSRSMGRQGLRGPRLVAAERAPQKASLVECLRSLPRDSVDVARSAEFLLGADGRGLSPVPTTFCRHECGADRVDVLGLEERLVTARNFQNLNLGTATAPGLVV
jgi:hypothetical protein